MLLSKSKVLIMLLSLAIITVICLAGFQFYKGVTYHKLSGKISYRDKEYLNVGVCIYAPANEQARKTLQKLLDKIKKDDDEFRYLKTSQELRRMADNNDLIVEAEKTFSGNNYFFKLPPGTKIISAGSSGNYAWFIDQMDLRANTTIDLNEKNGIDWDPIDQPRPPQKLGEEK